METRLISYTLAVFVLGILSVDICFDNHTHAVKT